MAKKLKVGKSLKKAIGIGGQILGTGVTLAGAIFGGEPGAAAGAVVGSVIRGATTTGNRDAKLTAAKKQLAIGGGIVAATGLINLVSGNKLGTPLAKSVPSLFNTAPAAHEDALKSTPLAGDKEWDSARGEWTSKTAPTASGSSRPDAALAALGLLGAGQQGGGGQPTYTDDKGATDDDVVGQVHGESKLPLVIAGAVALYFATRRESA